MHREEPGRDPGAAARSIVTSSPVRAERSASAIASLEQVWRWFAATAGEDVDWRAYMNLPARTSAHSVIVVVWDSRRAYLLPVRARSPPALSGSDRP